MHDEATSIEDELAQLAESWDGVAFAAYHTAIEAVVAQMRASATAARAIVDALRLAADLLRGHQERIPVPARLVNAVFRAHHQRRESAGGAGPSNADFEQAVHADVVEREPWLTAPQALEQANVLFLQQQQVARRVYRELTAAYNGVAQLLPAVPAPPVTLVATVVAPEPEEEKHHGRGRYPGKDLAFDDDNETAEPVAVEVAVIDVAEEGVIDLPVAVTLGAQDGLAAPSGGHRLSRYGDGPSGRGGPADTGASFGVPVTVMNTPTTGSGMGMGVGTPGLHTGLGMGTPGMSTPSIGTPGGMGTHMGPHMGSPMHSSYGGVIGGFGEGDNNSTWLTEHGDDPTEQDGQSSGAVLS
jgi:hypothetical protein